MEKLTYLDNISPEIIDDLYRQYLTNPDSIDNNWKKFFEGFTFAQTNYSANSQQADFNSTEFNVIDLINAYRERGHLFTPTNPVRTRRKYFPTLDINNFGLSENDLQKEFLAGNEIGIGKKSLQEIVNHLKDTYCKSVGVEFMYIRTPEIVEWLKIKMESSKNTPHFTEEQKKKVFQKLSEAVLFEKFLHKKFPGQKSFSLEGLESLIPALDGIIENGSKLGIEEYIIGMAHRGRLNVLGNIMHKAYYSIFSEFEGKEYDDITLLGDVKYHLGYTSKRKTSHGSDIQLTIVPNPSHLETVNPVVEGISRAKIDADYNGNNAHVVPILIHGDAAIAGQGIVYEVLQMSQLEGYKTGGTVHLILNNQIGFTTNYIDARSSVYCTDVAKTIQSPIFHVNGDDVEAVAYTIQLAMEFRQKFHRDVFIDILGYRKYGHNESDEPRYTQPILYKIIEKHPNPKDIYAKKLIEENVINDAYNKSVENDFNSLLESNLTEAKQIEKAHITNFLDERWTNFRKAEPNDFIESIETRIDKETLLFLTDKITEIPQTKPLFKKVVKLLQDRKDMVYTNDAIDWGMGELLAYGSILNEGFPIRVSGQDVERGTFSHRHAVIKFEDSEEEYIAVNNLHPNQPKLDIYNSLLSEYGVLGFEYGYALTSPETLTIWEAQFGDFFNGAQIIIDQMISSAEDKWNVYNGLVVLLPHGFEGQGPEHSSARMERFLTLCAEYNMQVANCTTPANFFHLLRRQIKRDFRKPLVVFTPKSLLRHPKCVSKIEEFTNGKFQEVIDDATAKAELVEKVVFCNGKVFYDLMDEKIKRNDEKIAILRIEQIFPLPITQLKNIIAKYNNASRYVWVQEEPENMGAWYFIYHNFTEIKLNVIARPASGSPATGSSKFHVLQQRKIVEKTFEECDCENVCNQCKMLCLTK